ncbi:insulinase family protein [Sphingomonas colocasiae]|uniref:Peptidase M16 C-terminal domain-containing protein n=1 Tax=Sphingomonas colocasiae TaxID=1848973 RepID=A0ABS7PPS6_9SPHN|nr:insulinase family protein [Sphingomonas colocasiae]MBY8823327.1 hypothetical protein [Sphingomonas colocasiae]MBY8826462.1 hypothetical protein [Sphingomonas colocasiae]
MLMAFRLQSHLPFIVWSISGIFFLGGIISSSVSARESSSDFVTLLDRHRESSRAGVLSNGFRYVITSDSSLPADKRRTTISMRLHVNGGEADLIQVPHLLEHVLVREFKTPEGDTLKSPVDLFRYWGLEATNIANTDEEGNIDFRLDVPKGRELEALGYLRGIARKTLLSRDDILVEASIVKAEALKSIAWDREFHARKVFSRLTSFQVGDALALEERQIDSIVKTRPHDVERYYEERFRANNQTIYIEGDLDAAAMEQAVHERFSDIPGGARLSPPGRSLPDLAEGVIAYLPGLDACLAGLHLGYNDRDAVNLRHKTAVQLIIQSLWRRALEKSSARNAFPAGNILLLPREARKGGGAGGIDVEFSALVGEFPDALEELVRTLKSVVAGGNSAEFERVKAEVQTSVPGGEGGCQDDIPGASDGGGQLPVKMPSNAGCGRSLTSSEIAAVAFADVKSELQQLLDPRSIGFRAVTRTGDQQVSMAAVRKAFATKAAPAHKLTPAITLPELPRNIRLAKAPYALSLKAVRDGIFRVSNSETPIFVERGAPGNTFRIDLYGAKLESLGQTLPGLADKIMGLARLSGFGPYDAGQFQTYLASAGLRLDIVVGSSSRLTVSGPSGKMEEGMNLLVAVLNGPNVDTNVRRHYLRRLPVRQCGFNDMGRAINAALQSGLPPPSSFAEICNAAAALPNDAALAETWAQLFGDAKRWVIVAHGSQEDEVVEGLRTLADKFGQPRHRLSSDLVPQAQMSPQADNHYVVTRGEGPDTALSIYIPVNFAENADRDGMIRSLEAAFPLMGRFWKRIRVVEAGAYAPMEYVSTRRGRRDHALIQISFVCDPADSERLIAATWDEFAAIQRDGLDADAAARVQALRPTVVRLIDELGAPERYALTSEEAAGSRTIVPASVDELTKAIRATRREDMIVFELRP